MSVRSHSGRRWSYNDYAMIPPDLFRHEIVDGEHFVNPAPNLYHQEISGRLQAQLLTAIADNGNVYAAPVDVQLSDHDIVQPDLVVVLRDNSKVLTPTKIVGTPNLVIEILSRSTRRHDRERKMSLYLNAGVPEYWIVDPDAHTVEVHALGDDAYRRAGVFSERLNETRLGVEIDLTRVW